MTQYGFYVNTDICTGCKACMTACFDRNDLEVPHKFRRVYEYGGGGWTQDENGAFTTTAFAYYVSLTCNHCDDPLCVDACPTTSMRKDAQTGIVNNLKDLCIGCMSCQLACPYHHPNKFDDGLSHKCDMCVGTSQDGVPDPACVKACPVRALDFGEIGELRAKYGGNCKIADFGDITKPNLVIGVHRDAAKGGELLNPTEISTEG